MFTLQQLKAAHAKVKSGADFPAYVQEIKQLGLSHYQFMVDDGRTVYHSTDGEQVSGDAIYPLKTISIEASPAIVKQIITDHQQGKNDFMTFCQLVADAGVEKWVVDTSTMLCSYYDLQGNTMVAEPIPQSGY
ncbi:DUF1398 domain-containing protein [Mucilaginibacter myungsuensis]|uniref:DUF1398 family protein n=1 Tax=Mucilaginibacter myungsuensis TaxID=649104 RepID=A0A929KZB4_9SPHI|nr:DUF1398 family protein [Mucilaginibacter myungsuensis]MBE9663392.1 DUF1398 family protein [Mucilaginibacter myungsuensis]MDN3600129.1 DUF1398 family protein [Mucilaginibacter myungsuensis]